MLWLKGAGTCLSYRDAWMSVTGMVGSTACSPAIKSCVTVKMSAFEKVSATVLWLPFI